MIRFPMTHCRYDRIPAATEREIQEEPMFFHAEPMFAYEHGGPITRRFIETVFKDQSRLDEGFVIDSRTHMLKPGWYPCIPGWHIDGLRRPVDGGQPDFNNLPEDDEHYLCILGDSSLTEWVDQLIDLPEPDPEHVYESFSKSINTLIEWGGRVGTVRYGSGAIVKFGASDFHRGTPANKDGWRFFIRASKADMKVFNEIRHQTQVYIPSVDAGW